MSFLKAEWRKLAIANYVVDPAVLKSYLPYKTELDLWNDTCYVSLVGFLFENVRVLGLKIPFHSRFEEINLRFYVKHFHNNEWKRGVVFIKEIVPKRAITLVANTLYHENYQTAPTSHNWLQAKDTLQVDYNWKINKLNQFIKIKARAQLQDILPGSETEFITQHFWGYTRVNHIKTYEYNVTHPRWMAYDILEHEIRVDFALVYGNDFAFLNHSNPSSVMLAEGSAITVEKKKRI